MQWVLPVVNGGQQSVPKAKRWAGGGREQTGCWSLSPSSSGPPRSYNPFEGPNENPEAELPLTAGEYVYIYGSMDEDGFFEGRR